MNKPDHNKKNLKDLRKELRRNMTSAEAFLWNELKDNKIEGRKFRRQHSINNFIVDFYCASEQLIIELDGQAHLNPTAEENDRRRDRILEGMGFKVLRFENKMVFENLESVLKEIRDNFRG